jgi:hypothetical protein
VLCWNVRGLNGESRQREMRSKIDENACDIICLQETKYGEFDWQLIKKIVLRILIYLLLLYLLVPREGSLFCGSRPCFRTS